MSRGLPPQANRILVVEDDPHLAAGVVENLRAEGYDDRMSVIDGRAGARLARREHAAGSSCSMSCCREIDGFTRVPHAARAGQQHAGAVSDRARRSGGSGARARGGRRRLSRQAVSPAGVPAAGARDSAALGLVPERLRDRCEAVLHFGGNEVDFRAFRARSWNGVAQELTEKEAMILKVLAERPGEIVSREDLLERVWGYDVFPSTRTVDNFILRLRKRFERDPANPRHFLTVWGVGIDS